MFVQAKLAEEAERYDDMVQNVKALAELNQALNVEVGCLSRDAGNLCDEMGGI